MITLQVWGCFVWTELFGQIKLFVLTKTVVQNVFNMLGFCLERYSYEQILFGKTDHISINIGILLPKLF